MEAESSKQATPLYIKPLHHYQYPPENDSSNAERSSSVNDSVGRCQVLFRKMYPAPQQRRSQASGTATCAELETRLEQFVDRNDGTVLWRRVVVSSGPCSTACCASSTSVNAIHASFLLPEGNATRGISTQSGFYSDPNLVCWTSFADRPDHDVLCVLAHPGLLCIWDVYSDMSQKSTMSHSVDQLNCPSKPGIHVSLPFDACGIFGSMGEPGLFLQRCETSEDYAFYEAWSRDNAKEDSHLADDINENNDGFVLRAPPKQVRLEGGESAGAPSKHGSETMFSNEEKDHSGLIGECIAVPSLFSLQHPLEDLRPVTLSEKTSIDGREKHAAPVLYHRGPVADAFEKILFMGSADFFDATGGELHVDRSKQSQTIFVTYHTQLKR